MPRRMTVVQDGKRPLRVLMVTGIYPTPRQPHSGTFVKTLVDALATSGIGIEIVHPRPAPVPLRYVSATVQVFFRTLRHEFDIVHGHYGLWCLAARMQWTTPVIAAYLGSDVLGDPRSDGSLTTKGRITTAVSRWLCRFVDVVTVKTDEMRRALPTDNVVVIPDGIDFTLFRPMSRLETRASLGWDQHRSYVLFANNPAIPVKGFPLAQQAMERLHQRGLSAELVVATGLPQTTVVQYINASNVLVLPSISEGSPNVVKEAMACNVPVVAVDVGDVAQLISQTAGCYVCERTPDALADALMKALQRREPTTGRADIARMDRSVIVRQVIALYGQTLSRQVQHAHPRQSAGERRDHAPAS